jgi:hypothetical protein
MPLVMSLWDKVNASDRSQLARWGQDGYVIWRNTHWCKISNFHPLLTAGHRNKYVLHRTKVRVWQLSRSVGYSGSWDMTRTTEHSHYNRFEGQLKKYINDSMKGWSDTDLQEYRSIQYQISKLFCYLLIDKFSKHYSKGEYIKKTFLNSVSRWK